MTVCVKAHVCGARLTTQQRGLQNGLQVSKRMVLGEGGVKLQQLLCYQLLKLGLESICS
jgi:hypothetical protein